MKKLIYRNQSQIDQIKSLQEQGIPVLQEFIDEGIKAHSLNLTTENFWTALRDPEKFAINDFEKDIPQEELVSHGRLSKSTKKSIDNYELPDITEFIRLAKKVKETFSGLRVSYSYYKIVNGKVVIDENAMETLRDNNSTYIDDPNDIEEWELLKSVTDAMTNLEQYIKKKYKREYIGMVGIADFIQKMQINGREEFFPNIGQFKNRTNKTLN